LAKIDLRWNDRSSLGDTAETGIHDLLGVSERAKPLFVLFTPSLDEVEQSKLDAIFKDERVMIGARFFTMVRVPTERVSERLAQAVGRTALQGIGMAAFDARGTLVALIDSKHSPSKTFGLMKDTVKRTMPEVSVDATAKSLQRLLTDLDKVDAERKQIELALSREGLAEAKKAKLDRQKEELAQRQAKIDEQETALWKKVFESSAL
jgi:hypothetical protein